MTLANLVAVLLGVLTVLVPYVVLVRRTDAALAQERARISDLIELLQVREAPAEYAFLHPFPEADRPHTLTSPDGLVTVEYEPEDV